MSEKLACFKAYDIRGHLPDELNVDIAYRIGRAYAEYIKPQKMIVGHDVRESSIELSDAVARGLADGGSDVYDIGLCGTEQVYFSTFHYRMDGGMMVTASHNPTDYNGMKLVRQNAIPISGDSGLHAIRQFAERNVFESRAVRGKLHHLDVLEDYCSHLLGYIDIDKLQPFKIVVNAGNGGAGLIIDALESRLPFEFVKIHHEPDGSFPHGVPNPLLPDNRNFTSEAVKKSGADFGLAWDGDFDRCFFFDEHGVFIEGYYLVGLLAEVFLRRNPGSRIIHDPRLTWNTIDIVRKNGGTPIQSKTGHAFIKERMRLEDAVYGGEMSAHHYFRDFAYCDSGMIPWLLVAQYLSGAGKTLSQLVRERVEAFPCSGEINFHVQDADQSIEKILSLYEGDARKVDRTDGISVEFPEWRFNLRASNTEPVLRLNVETRHNRTLLDEKVRALTREVLSKP